MFKEMAQPRPQDAINQLDRQDQSLIFQFTTQHTRTHQHLNRINPQHQPHCRHCDNPAETTEHLLLYCPKLQLKGKELLPTNPTIHSTLYGQLDQLWTTRPTEEDKHFHPPGIDCTRVKNSIVWDQQQKKAETEHFTCLKDSDGDRGFHLSQRFRW